MSRLSLFSHLPERVFLFSRKELILLLTLAFFMGLYCFTLGLYYGRRLVPAHYVDRHPASYQPLKPLKEKEVDLQKLLDESRDLNADVEELLGTELHEEILKLGIQLQKKRDLELPEKKVK